MLRAKAILRNHNHIRQVCKRFLNLDDEDDFLTVIIEDEKLKISPDTTNPKSFATVEAFAKHFAMLVLQA